MPILYSAVANEESIISEFASCDGNFVEILNLVISRIPEQDHKMTYFHGPYLIHYIVENQFLYFCITDKMCQRSRAFLFLNEIHRKFLTRGKDDFIQTLAAQMYTYNEDYSTITVRKGEVDEVNKIGVESSESILGEKLILVNNPENISYAIVSYVGKPPERIPIKQIEESILTDEIEKSSIIQNDGSVTSPKSREQHGQDSTDGICKERPTPSCAIYKAVDNDDEGISNLTEEKSRFYIIIIGVLIFVIGIFYALSPMSCIVIMGVIGFSFVKGFKSYDKKSD